MSDNRLATIMEIRLHADLEQARARISELEHAFDKQKEYIARVDAALDAANKDADALFDWVTLTGHTWRCATKYGEGDKCTCGLMDCLNAHAKRVAP